MESTASCYSKFMIFKTDPQPGSAVAVADAAPPQTSEIFGRAVLRRPAADGPADRGPGSDHHFAGRAPSWFAASDRSVVTSWFTWLPGIPRRWWVIRFAWLDQKFAPPPWAPEGRLWCANSASLNSADALETTPATSLAPRASRLPALPRFLPPPLHASVHETHARIVQSAVE